MNPNNPNKKLKLLQVDSGTEWRGGQGQVYLLCKGLVKAGHKVHLATPPNSPLSQKLANENIQFHPIGTKKGFKPFSYLSMRKVIREIQPDAVHVHTSHAHGAAYSALDKKPQIPLIVSRRVDFPISNNFFSRKKYLHPNNHYFAISNGVKQVLIDGGVTEEKISLVPSGIDFSKFDLNSEQKDIRQEFDISAETFLIGTVGALVDHKDHQTLIEAAEILKQADLDFQVFIAGSGELQKNIERVIAEKDLKTYVRLIGYRKDIQACLESFDLFALSSKLEGLCTSVIDAMYMRVPVVGTNTGGVPDLVIDGQTGILVPPQNANKLAEAILEMQKNPAKMKVFSEVAFKHVENNFSADKMVANTIEAYYSLT